MIERWDDLANPTPELDRFVIEIDPTRFLKHIIRSHLITEAWGCWDEVFESRRLDQIRELGEHAVEDSALLQSMWGESRDSMKLAILEAMNLPRIIQYLRTGREKPTQCWLILTSTAHQFIVQKKKSSKCLITCYPVLDWHVSDLEERLDEAIFRLCKRYCEPQNIQVENRTWFAANVKFVSAENWNDSR